jgi:hypothetical protein
MGQKGIRTRMSVSCITPVHERVYPGHEACTLLSAAAAGWIQG